MIAIQQRLHEDDPAGFLLSKGTYHHLDLPAIAPQESVIDIGPGRVHRRQAGTPLFPQRFDLPVLDQLRRELGNAAFEIQYQQNPIAAGASALRWEWFGTYDGPPVREWFQLVVQSWDTGLLADPTSDWSVCTTWGLREERWYLLDVYRARLDYPNLKRHVLKLCQAWRADKLLIEKAGSGIPLLQDCRRGGSSSFRPVQPIDDKEVRFQAACAPIEAGTVLLPANATWLEDFRRELLGFPRSKYDDQADSVSQFLNWIRSRGLDRALPRGQRRERIVIRR